MIPASVVHACSSLLAILAAPAIRSLSLACLAALALGALRVRGVATRLAVWTAVLYAALVMPLLGVILPSISLKVPPEAARFISQRLNATIVPLAGEKISEVRVTPPAPVAATSEVDSASQNSSISSKHFLTRNRVRASSHAAPIVADRSSIAESPSFSDSRSAIVPVAPAAPAARAAARVPWAAIAAAIYFVVAILFLARLILGFFFSRRLVRSANPVTAWEATCPLAIQARDAGLMVIPDLAESAAISVPVTMGILRPVILFPVEWREWDLAALHAVIAHELSHVIRRDALTQRLSLVHRAIFWFSPLSWWLHRCLADAAEEASDEAALVSGADRARYAETLLGFFAALQESPRRVYWHGVSMAKAGQAEKRVDRILAWKGDVGMRMNKFVAIAMILAGVPAVIFTAAARPSLRDTPVVNTQAAGSQATEQVANPAPDPAPKPTPAPKALGAPQAPAAPKTPTPAAAPAPPAAPSAPALKALPREPLPPIPPAPAAAPTPMPLVQVTFDGSINKERLMELQAEIKQWTMDNKDKLKDEMSAEITKIIESQLKDLRVNPKIQVDVSKVPQTDPLVRVKMRTDGFSDRYVVVSGDSPIFMSGDSQDVEHATALRGKIGGDFIWFQRDEKSYVIRDQATLNRAKEFFKPQQQLGEKQQALGKQQQALGDQQRDLGKKMQTVQIQLPDMSADMQKLEAEMKQLSAGATQQQVGDLQRQIGELQRKIGQAQSQVGDQMRKDSEPMRALGQQQRDLGQQQRELGQQQRDAARQARDQMKQLLDDAVTKGTAQPE